MVLKQSDERDRPKRGRPFEKGNQLHKKRKDLRKDLVDSGLESGDQGGVVALTPETVTPEPSKSVLNELPNLVIKGLEKQLKEAMETPAEEPKEEKEGEIKTIESLDFMNGENKLSIRFSAVNNRRFRIQVFLNDETEVRPVTYQGSSSGYAFWKLLKGALKK